MGFEMVRSALVTVGRRTEDIPHFRKPGWRINSGLLLFIYPFTLATKLIQGCLLREIY